MRCCGILHRSAEWLFSMVRLPEKQMSPADAPPLFAEPEMETVREFLSSFIVRLNPDYHWTEDGLYGIDWHSSPSSLAGSIEGIHVPTLIMSGQWDGIASFEDLLAFFARLPNPDKHFAVMPGISHASFQQKNYALVYHILWSFFTQPAPIYRG